MKNESGTAATVKSAERVVTILQKLAERPVGMTFTELKEKSEIPKSSLYQLISTLEHKRMIQLDSVTKKYYLGIRIWEFATEYSNKAPINQIADPYLDQLLSKYDQTIQMAILDEADVVYISKKTSSQPLQLVSQVGMRLPAYVTGIGKALLACLPEQKVKELYPQSSLKTYTNNTIDSREKLLDELKATRERGYARDLGEYSPGILCVAAPVLGFNNSCVAAVSITILEEEKMEWKEEILAEGLSEVVQELSFRLGATNPKSWREYK